MVTSGSESSALERQAANPPEQPFRVLMVCTANRIRSVMAEYLLRAKLADLAVPCPIEVAGAGTLTLDGEPIMPLAAEELVRRGLDPAGFASRALTARIVEGADLVLTATRDHRARVLEEVPLALKRTFTLLEFAALVAGPAGKGVGDGDKIGDGAVGGGVLGMTPPAPTGAEPTQGKSRLQALVRVAAANRGSVALADHEFDIADPVGRPAVDYEYAAAMIDRATDVIAAAIAQVHG